MTTSASTTPSLLVYHERQSLMRCGLPTVNHILQCAEYTKMTHYLDRSLPFQEKPSALHEFIMQK